MSEIAAMKTLLALRDCESLTQAAQHMDEPKSTLSRRLANLEISLGQPLTYQNGRRLSLTSAGLCYAEYAEKILRLANEGRQAINTLKNEPSGELRVGLCSELSRGWSTDALNRFGEAYPDVSLDIRILDENDAHQKTDLDLLISCCDRTFCSELKSRLLGRWEQGLYAAVSFKNSISNTTKLEQYRWICSADTGDEIQLYTDDSQMAFILHTEERMKINSLHMRADAIALGYGIGLLPCWIAECRRHRLQGLRRIYPNIRGKDVQLRIHYHPQRKTAAVTALQEWFTQQLPKRWNITP